MSRPLKDRSVGEWSGPKVNGTCALVVQFVCSRVRRMEDGSCASPDLRLAIDIKQKGYFIAV